MWFLLTSNSRFFPMVLLENVAWKVSDITTLLSFLAYTTGTWRYFAIGMAITSPNSQFVWNIYIVTSCNFFSKNEFLLIPIKNTNIYIYIYIYIGRKHSRINVPVVATVKILVGLCFENLFAKSDAHSSIRFTSTFESINAETSMISFGKTRPSFRTRSRRFILALFVFDSPKASCMSFLIHCWYSNPTVNCNVLHILSIATDTGI